MARDMCKSESQRPRATSLYFKNTLQIEIGKEKLWGWMLETERLKGAIVCSRFPKLWSDGN